MYTTLQGGGTLRLPEETHMCCTHSVNKSSTSVSGLINPASSKVITCPIPTHLIFNLEAE